MRLASAIEAAQHRHQHGRKVDIEKGISSSGNTEQVIRNAKTNPPQQFSRKCTTADTGTSLRTCGDTGRDSSSNSHEGEEV